MASPVSSIRNLGPAMEAAFAKAGIHSADEIRQLGADEAYIALVAAGTRPHFIAYYSLIMGLQGRPWNDATPDEKTRLRRRFDRIKSASKNSEKVEEMPPELANMLNWLGVREPDD